MLQIVARGRTALIVCGLAALAVAAGTVPLGAATLPPARAVVKAVPKKPVLKAVPKKPAPRKPVPKRPAPRKPVPKKPAPPKPAPPKPAPTPPVAGSTRIGFSTDGFFEWESDADLARDLDATAATGAGWIRLSFDWSKIQKTRNGPLDWTWENRMVAATQARGLKILGLVTYTPAWARRPSCSWSDKCPPQNPADFAAFANAVAQTYAPKGIHAWEIWNEPNNPDFWAGAVNAADYVALLRPTYTAIHRADPAATVVSGGLAPHGDLGSNPGDVRSPVNFVKAMYAAGVRGSLDALGHHPYPPLPYAPNAGSLGWNAVLQTALIHDTMTAYGDGAKQIWGTEFGTPTGTTSMGVSEAVQAQYITTEVRQWTAWSFTGPVFVHMIRDRGYDHTDWGYDLGLMRVDGTPKPAYLALKALLGR